MELRDRQIMVLFISMFIFTLGFGIIVPVLAYFTRDMGATSLDVGILMALFSAMEFLFAPLWGRISDLIGRRPVILMGLFGFGVSFTITGFSTQLWMVYVSQTLAGVCASGIFPSVTAYIADITDHEGRIRLMGMLGAASGLGIIIGPSISSVCAIWGLNVPFFAAAAIAMATFVFGAMFLPESKKSGWPTARAKKTPLISSLKTPLGGLFFMMFFVSFAMACIDGTLSYYVMDKFGLSEAASRMPVLGASVMLTGPNVTGITFTLMGAISVVCQGILIGRVVQRIGEEKTIMAGLAMIAVGMALLVGVFDLATLLLCNCLISIGMGFVSPCVNTLVSKRTDAERQGSTMGVLGSFNSLGRILGPTVGGLVYMFSVAILYFGSAAIAALSALGIRIWMDKMRGDAIKAATRE
ncbi:MFS transporter [Methanocella conradii]|uniref:MFS transporter n=1 Tax=Methanocella conradii TaxID=1175444 RepID=UPI0024B3399E|nr:MFS transporter [Methanocella conradii]MDI6897882.1 MFS transporter [Methanocella conradii]